MGYRRWHRAMEALRWERIQRQKEREGEREQERERAQEEEEVLLTAYNK